MRMVEDGCLMVTQNINWIELKRENYLKWRSILWRETAKLLTGPKKVDLSRYNELGYFHKLSSREEFEMMRREWERSKSIPEEWIGKGIFPGIWTAMFSPFNTFSISTLPVPIMRFHFKKGYFILDRLNESHQALFLEWLKKNKETENPWKNLINSKKESLEERLRINEYPYHKKFFEDNNFGAIVGYSDYIAVVIVLEESIKEAEFFLIR